MTHLQESNGLEFGSELNRFSSLLAYLLGNFVPF